MGLLKIFKNRKKMQEAPPSALADAKARKIAHAILKTQRRLAVKLNGWFAQLSAKQKKVLMLLLGGLFGLYCLYVLLSAVLD